MRPLNIYVTIIIFIFSFISYGQEFKVEIEQLKLADSSIIKNNQRIMVLFENDSVKVLTTRKFFMQSCKAWAEYMNVTNTHQFYKCANSYNSKNTLSDIANKNDLKWFFEKVYQSLILEENKCLVYNKKKKKLEKKIFAKSYDIKNNNFGLEYKSENNILILKTEDFSCF